MKSPRDLEVLIFQVKQFSGSFSSPNIIFKQMQKQQKRDHRVTMSQLTPIFDSWSYYLIQ